MTIKDRTKQRQAQRGQLTGGRQPTDRNERGCSNVGITLQKSNARLTAESRREESREKNKGGSPATGHHRPAAGVWLLDRSAVYSNGSLRRMRKLLLGAGLSCASKRMRRSA